LLLLGAVAAVVSAFAIARRHAGTTGAADVYDCPMHPEVTTPGPGDCPICRMALQPRRGRSQPATGAVAAAAHATAEQVSLPPGISPPDIGKATRLFVSQELRAPAWLEGEAVGALFYLDEIALLGPGERGVFRPAASAAADAGAPIEVEVTGEAPVRWDASTARVRLRPAAGAPLRQGEVGWVEFGTRQHKALVVPASAVLQSPSGPSVFVASADGRTFTKRSIETGRILFGFATVVSGVREGQALIAHRPIFVENERRLGARPPTAGAAP
jgi:hypothetical protein